MKKKIGKAVKIIVWVILFAVIFFLLLLPARYMNTVYGYLPVFMFAAVVLLSAVSLGVLYKKISLEADYQDTECERGSSVSIGLKMVNHARLYCPKLAANIFISDLFWNQDSAAKTFFTMPPKSKTDFGFDVDMNHIGVYHVGVKDMELYDFLGIFKRKIKINGELDVFVKPRLRDLEEFHEAEEVLAESSNDTRTTMINGTDYIGVREYEMGDSMKQIHWKLSAHTREYMTKIYESSRQMDFAVVLDFAAEKNKDKEELMDINDCLIETALSVIRDISKRHTEYSLIFCNRDHEVQRVSMRGLDNDELELVKNFAVICPEPGAEFPDAAEIVKRENGMSNRSTNVIVCTSRVTEELLQELLRVKRQRRNPELYFIVPARLTKRELESKRAALRRLDEAAVLYHFVATSENLKAAKQYHDADEKVSG